MTDDATPIPPSNSPEAEMRAAGYEPLEPYPGRVAAPWRVVCSTCGAERTPTLNGIRNGRRCGHSQPVKPDGPAAELRAAGYEPQGPYPGKITAPWRAVCTTCQAERTPSLDAVRRGHRCRHRGTPHHVVRAALTLSDEEIAQQYQGGKSIKAIARETGHDTGTIRRRLTDQGIEIEARTSPHPRAHTELPEGEVIAAYRDGKTLSQLADIYGVTIKVIRDLMERRGEPRRAAGGKPPALTGAQIATVLERHHQGDSVRQIAADLGVSRSPVARVIAMHATADTVGEADD